MKRAIVFVALGMTVAGVASASVYTATSSTVLPVSPSGRAALPAERPSPSQIAVKPVVPAKPEATTKAFAPVVQKASVDVRQAPVPLQVKPRPAVTVAPVDPQTETAKPGEAGSPQEASTTSDAFNENAAKAAIEADGYKSVRVLRKGGNGVWHATAMRGQTVVPVVVDASGSVSAE